VAALQSESMTTTILHLDSEAPEMPVRTGPDANYNRLACESDGYYVYESYPAALEDQLRRLALAYEGVWSAQVEIGADDGGSFTPMSDLDPGWYRLSTTLRVDLVDDDATFGFQLRNLSTLLVDSGTVDTRILLHVQD